jgi:hypothetical protein
MKQETGTNQEIPNFIGQSHSFEDLFLRHDKSIDNNVAFKVNYSEAAFVVEWQMENNKQGYSVKHK